MPAALARAFVQGLEILPKTPVLALPFIDYVRVQDGGTKWLGVSGE
jgi:hypothetical protein